MKRKFNQHLGILRFQTRKSLQFGQVFFFKRGTRRDVWLKVSQTNLKGLRQGNEVESISKRDKISESCHGLLSGLLYREKCPEDSSQSFWWAPTGWRFFVVNTNSLVATKTNLCRHLRRGLAMCRSIQQVSKFTKILGQWPLHCIIFLGYHGIMRHSGYILEE